MNSKKIRKKNKRKLIITGIIIGIVVLFHAVWLLNRYVKYGEYARAVGYNTRTSGYDAFEEEGAYYVVLPGYPTFTGFMNIDVSDEENAYSLYIYPGILDGFECEFSYTDKEAEETIYIWFDENFDKLEAYESTANFEDYEEKIQYICGLAYDKWGILKYDKE